MPLGSLKTMIRAAIMVFSIGTNRRTDAGAGGPVATGTVLMGGPQMGGSRSELPNPLSALAEAGIDKPLRQTPLKLLIRLESRLRAP
jgi:hypothetical protein